MSEPQISVRVTYSDGGTGGHMRRHCFTLEREMDSK